MLYHLKENLLKIEPKLIKPVGNITIKPKVMNVTMTLTLRVYPTSGLVT
jgi:hypothetical protein